jgi:hypothetical protein
MIKMNYKNILFVCFTFVLLSCSSDNDETVDKVAITFNFTHSWENTNVSNTDFGVIKFTNKNGEELSIDRLRYLISGITLTHNNGGVVNLETYQLVDLSSPETLSLTTEADIIPGEYSVSFRFGFNNDDNKDGFYPDLNLASFNVPGMLGGGYHFMQMDGSFTDAQNTIRPYNFHAIRAFDNSDPNNPTLTDTSFSILLPNVTIGNNTDINLNMDISEWFKNPNLWNLNTLSVNLMSNAEAQLAISQNGLSVFSLISVTE